MPDGVLHPGNAGVSPASNRISAQQPLSTVSADRRLPATDPFDAEVVARAKALAAGLKARLQTVPLPPPIVEVAYLLEESRNPACPLLERIRILGLLASSLDQYFAEHAPVPSGHASAPTALRPDGATSHPLAAIADAPFDWEEITARLEPLLQQAFVDLQETLLPALAAEYGIALRRPQDLSGQQREHLRQFFHQQIYPMLTPLAIDPGHPFPFISSHSLNLLVHLSRPEAGVGPLSYARIKVPPLLSRFVGVPTSAGPRLYLWSEDAVADFLSDLFPGMQVERVFLFRVLRATHRSHYSDTLAAQSRRLRNLQLASPVVRLEVEASMPDRLVEWLAYHLPVPLHLCYRSAGPLALFQLVDLANLAHA